MDVRLFGPIEPCGVCGRDSHAQIMSEQNTQTVSLFMCKCGNRWEPQGVKLETSVFRLQKWEVMPDDKSLR